MTFDPFGDFATQGYLRNVEKAPSNGHLDDYLKPFIRAPISHEELSAQVMGTPGLDGRTAASDENHVVGEIDVPQVKAQYEAMLLKRRKRNET